MRGEKIGHDSLRTNTTIQDEARWYATRQDEANHTKTRYDTPWQRKL